MRTNILDYLDRGGLESAPQSNWIQDGELAWSFEQFAGLTRRIGSALIDVGVGPGHVVAVFFPNSAHVLAGDFGILRTGAAFMNLDVTLPTPRLRAIFDSVDPRMILVTQALREKIPADLMHKTVVYEDLLEAAIDEHALARRRSSLIDTDPACLISTSGSTGVPKAVALSHRGLIDFGDWFDQTFDFNANDVVGSLSPLFFDGYIPGLFMSLLHGGKFVILPKEAAAFPVKLAEQLVQRDITFIFWVPSTLVPMAKFRILDSNPMPKLRFVGFAGEVMPPTTLTYFRNALPHAQFVNFYGPIEVSVICTYFVVPPDFPEDMPVPIGVPCANSRVLVLDEGDALCATGQAGELCVAGSCVALGYWNNPEKTEAAFVRNPLVASHAETIYRTGDIAAVEADGNISFVGRKDFQIKHQGYRIDLGEIEHAADVALGAKAVSVIYDRSARTIVLFYEAVCELSAQEVRSELGARLPKYMLPQKIVRLVTMPLNPNGKIDRKLLESSINLP